MTIKDMPGLEDVLKGIDSKVPEEEREIEVVAAVDFAGLMRKYEEVLELHYFKNEGLYMPPIDITLTPEEISQFIHIASLYDEHKRYGTNAGCFISQLIWDSYAHGHDRFDLDLTPLGKAQHVALNIRGTEQRPVWLNIKAGNCYRPAQGVKYGHVSIDSNKDQDMVGGSARNSRFHVTGDIGTYFAMCAHESEFIIYGDIYGGEETGDFKTKDFAHSSSCTFVINGRFMKDKEILSTDCTFKTPREDTLEQLKRYATEGNRVVFMRPDGKEEIVRDYDDPA